MVTRPTIARVVFLGLLLGLATTPLAGQCPDCVFPGAEWERLRGSELAGAGWDARALRGVSGFLADSANSTGVVVVQKGRVVFTFGDIEELSYLASVRKSILSMLYGYWVENGTIDLESTMEEMDRAMHPHPTLSEAIGEGALAALGRALHI